jgi:opacity protein-like surface antigen
MKTFMIASTLICLAFAPAAANAQTQPAASAGMGGAESALRAKGNVKGADRIARAKCFSGMGACSGKYAAQREQASKRARAQEN